MRRRAEFRPFNWIYDLYKRKQLDMDPPYQRRSVWSDRFRSEFITTALLDYPCPAIFLFEEIKPNGSFYYKVVDGKQRLTTLFGFVEDGIDVADDFPTMDFRSKFFSALPDETKLGLWRYSFAVEFIEQENEAVINDIFNRMNRNVARLTPQELRNAKYSGEFIETCVKLSEKMEEMLGTSFPRVNLQSRRQMKDVENIALYLLFIEQGERSLSQLDLDKAFSDRDDDWESRSSTEKVFLESIRFISNIIGLDGSGKITQSRLRNIADFYSLFAGIVELIREGKLPNEGEATDNILSFLYALDEGLENEDNMLESNALYLTAARSASNDAGPRRIRIKRIKEILLGE